MRLVDRYGSRVLPIGRPLNGEVPDKLAKLEGINDTGSMDFMHDPLSDGFGVSGSTEFAEVSAKRPELASIQPDRWL